MKIDEPKTPYIHYDASRDLLIGSSGVSPLELDEAMKEELEEAMKHISEDWSSDEDEEEPKRRKFSQLRTEHYNMKQVLEHSRELIGNEDLDPTSNEPDNGSP